MDNGINVRKSIYEAAREFRKKYPLTIAFRLKANSAVVQKHLDAGETPLYTFVGQKRKDRMGRNQTAVVTITDKRILIGRSQLFHFGYTLNVITPDMFNDLRVECGPVFGSVILDTVKEKVVITHLDRRSLDDIENHVSGTMTNLKKEYLSSSN